MRIYWPSYDASLVYRGAFPPRTVAADQSFTPWGQSAVVDIYYTISSDQSFTPWGQAAVVDIDYGVAADQAFTPWAQAAVVDLHYTTSADQTLTPWAQVARLSSGAPSTDYASWLFDVDGSGWRN